MHRLIAEEAGHTVISEMMKFVDHTDETDRRGSRANEELKKNDNQQNKLRINTPIDDKGSIVLVK